MAEKQVLGVSNGRPEAVAVRQVESFGSSMDLSIEEIYLLFERHFQDCPVANKMGRLSCWDYDVMAPICQSGNKLYTQWLENEQSISF